MEHSPREDRDPEVQVQTDILELKEDEREIRSAIQHKLKVRSSIKSGLSFTTLRLI